MTSLPFVVVTSIHAPTQALRRFADRVGDRLIVVGDRKTPRPWSLPPADYLDPELQLAGDSLLAPLLPWNHYCRKMLGYLHAIRRGADVIYDTDDDNEPRPDWGVPPFHGSYETAAEGLGFVNVYRAFAETDAWPRGFPLRAVRDPHAILTPDQTREAASTVGVWQSLAHGDPDVDAIYRLVNGAPCSFRDRSPLVLGTGTLCPFNSQATAFRRPLFPLLYLPASVTPRFTDILRGLVAQPIMWAAGYHLGFSAPTVVQRRNPHDLFDDFEAEIPVYQLSEAIPAIVGGAIRPGATIGENLLAAYRALARAGVVNATEGQRVEAWLHDIKERA